MEDPKWANAWTREGPAPSGRSLRVRSRHDWMHGIPKTAEGFGFRKPGGPRKKRPNGVGRAGAG